MSDTDIININEHEVEGELFFLHPSQESVYYEQQLHPDNPMYNIGGYQTIDHQCDLSLLQQSWRYLYEKLDSLRLNIVPGNGSVPRQYALPPTSESELLEYLDFSTAKDADNAAKHWMQQRFDTPMDYHNGERHQIALLQISERKYYLFTRFHHLFIDGLGIYRLYERLHQVYHALSNGKPIAWLDILPQYRDQVVSARNYLDSARYRRDKEYWQDLLASNEATRLPRYYPHSGSSESRCELSAGLAKRLNQYCEKYQTSILALLTAVASLYFGRILDKEAVVLGTAVHGRANKVSQQVVGMFSNIIPLHCSITPEDDFIAFARQICSQLRRSFRHSRFPASHIARFSGKEAYQLSDIHVLYEKFEDGSDVAGAFPANDHHMDITPISSQHDRQPLQIRLIDYQSNKKLALRVSYSKHYFDHREISEVMSRLINMLQFATSNEDCRVNEVPLLLESDIDFELHHYQKGNVAYSQDKTLIQLFEQQVAANPGRVAILFEEQQLTYGDLNKKANQLAFVIRRQYQQIRGEPLSPDTLVALYFDRSIDMIVAILAVLKAGAAYLPVDPKAPNDRTQFILEDARTELVLTQRHYHDRLDTIFSQLDYCPRMLAVNDNSVKAVGASENLSVVSHPGRLAYVIYTSGTTGKPKGVLQPHQNVVRLFEATRQDFQFNACDVWVLYHAYTFDFSVWEIWGPLLHGGALVIPAEEVVRDSTCFVELCRQHQVTVLNQTPAAFYLLADQVVAAKQLWPQLRYVIFGGDKLNLAQLTPWWAQYGDKHPRLVNMYGITETTVHVTYKSLSLNDSQNASHIGRPLSDMRCFILDEQLKPVPRGTAGELYVGGAGLARGYLNRPELTAERFIDNPYAGEQDYLQGRHRLYRTGDLVRRLADGNLEYLGRNDFQVKIRGYRIELGEVEAALVAAGQCKQAVVIDRERDGHRYLAAYLVPGAAGQINLEQLQDALVFKLPDYMLPATYSVIDTVPLTINGKLDKQRLPEPEFIDSDCYVAPRTALEDKLCHIWQQVLGLPKVGIQDNFFRIGGDSIVCIELVSLMRRAGLNVQVREIFKAPTVAQLAVRLSRSKQGVEVDAEQGELTGEFGLLPIQLQFFSKQLAKPHYWNQAFFVDLPATVSEAEMSDVLRLVVMQHDMLRCRFVQQPSGRISQVIVPYSDVQITLHRVNTAMVSDNELDDLLGRLQSHFNYTTGPLWQVAYLTGDNNGVARLWFAFHHLIIDAVSWRILVDDIRYLLSGGVLGNKTSSYRQWVAAVSDYATQHKHEAGYWRAVQEEQTVYPFAGKPRSYKLSLSQSQTEILQREASSGYQTEINDLLLGALAIALHQAFSTAVNHITLEAHGREEWNDRLDISRTVGWFTTLYPVRLEDQGDIAETILATKQMLREIPNKGLGYGALRQSGELADKPLPDVSFNYFGQFNNHSDLAGPEAWTIRTQGCGQLVADENAESKLFDINGVINHGVLTFSVESSLPERLATTFVRSFEQSLADVIETAAQGEQASSELALSHPQGYLLPGNRQWYFQRTKQLEQWGPCVLFELGDSDNYEQPARQAAEAVVRLHQGLRITIVDDGEGWKELIRESGDFDCFSYHDCSAMTEVELEQQLAEFRNSIDFSQSLIRFFYCDLGQGRQDWFYIAVHHLVMDRYSLSIFFRDFISAFEAGVQGKKAALTRVGASFADWLRETRHWLAGAEAQQSRCFWHEKLDLPVTSLPTDYAFSHTANTIGSRKELHQALCSDVSQRLKTAAETHGLNEYYFVITAIAKALSDWSGGGQVCFEEVLVGRDYYETLDLSGTIGWLNDYLPVFVNPDNGKSGLALVRSVRDEIQACKAHGKGFSELKFNSSNKPGELDISGLISPEIDINFIPETLSINQEAISGSKLSLTRYEEMVGSEREAIHKLSCTISFNQGALELCWEYGDKIYKQETVRYLSDACITALVTLISSVHR